jgi:3',5'-nucleoside bisphosphate phosphatase
MDLRQFRADLHVHTCLSPCGELTIFPRRIVELALGLGLDMVAVTDHNSAENADAVLRAAKGTGLAAFPGMEITSEEEVHILGIFRDMADILPLQANVFRALPEPPVKDRFREDQVIVDEEDAVVGFSPHFLMGAARLTVHEVVRLVHRGGGLAIASHIDREAFGIISQLGFVPGGLALDALEVSPLMEISEARAAFPSSAGFPLVRFSDAHRPEEIGRAVTEFILAAPTLDEIRMALKGIGGRRICPP